MAKITTYINKIILALLIIIIFLLLRISNQISAQADFSFIQSQFDNMNTSVEDVKTRLDNTNTSVEDMKNTLDKLDTSINDICDKLSCQAGKIKI